MAEGLLTEALLLRFLRLEAACAWLPVRLQPSVMILRWPKVYWPRPVQLCFLRLGTACVLLPGEHSPVATWSISTQPDRVAPGA
jgi:hypothetical protein